MPTLSRHKFQFLEEHLTKKLTKNTTTNHYQVGQKILGVTFYDNLDHLFGKSLEHIQVPLAVPADFRINCMVLEEDIQLPFQKEDYQRQGLLEGYNDTNFFTAFQHGADTYSFYDQAKNLGHYLVRDASLLPFWELSAPFRNIIHWWTKETDYQVIHAAHLDFDGVGILLSGKGGSGKSSTTLGSVLQGKKTLGEDYILVDTKNAFGYSLYRTGKLGHEAMKRFPELDHSLETVGQINEDKMAFFLDDQIEDSMLTYGKLKYHFIPSINFSSSTQIESTASAEGFKQMAPSTIFQLPRLQESNFRKCGNLCKSLETYRILLGNEPKEINDAIEEFVYSKQP